MSAQAQERPVASAEITATRGAYRANLDDWEVRISWRIGCSAGDRFAWSVHLRGKPAGEFITAAGANPANGGSRLVLVEALDVPYSVAPEIEARCYGREGATSDPVVVTGSAITIPPSSEGRQGAGTGEDYLDGNGEFDHRRRGGDGNGHGGYGGGGTSARLPERCENVIPGSSGDDVLNGTGEEDTVLGFGGSDRISGRGGGDCLLGHNGRDRMTGGPGPDVADGGSKRDVVAGGPGDDSIFGGPGPDRLSAGGGRNRLHGGAGNDVLDARNGRRDFVSCGRGRFDLARVDGLDRVRGCELRAR
jgi:Ca2+-binding RTX toxin-like protein